MPGQNNYVNVTRYALYTLFLSQLLLTLSIDDHDYNFGIISIVPMIHNPQGNRENFKF